MELLNSEELIRIGGVVLIVAMVLVESGIPIGFILPGDSLLFTAGVLCGSGILDIGIIPLMIYISIASFAGYNLGYWIGFKLTPLFLRKGWLKPEMLERAKDFYRKYKVPAIIISKYLPVVRTFLPIATGVFRTNLRTFTYFNFLGSVLWTLSFTGTGYFLVRLVPGISENIELIVIGLTLLMSSIVLLGALRVSLKLKKEKQVRSQLE